MAPSNEVVMDFTPANGLKSVPSADLDCDGLYFIVAESGGTYTSLKPFAKEYPTPLSLIPTPPKITIGSISPEIHLIHELLPCTSFNLLGIPP